jgi:DNA-binding CsgD family transcriptional regulator
VRLAALHGDSERAIVALEKLRTVSANMNGWPIAQRSMREAEGCFLLVQGDSSGADELIEAANDGEYPFWKAHLQLVAAHAKADRHLFLSVIETFDALGAEHAADRARALARSHGLRPGRKRETKGALSARETSVAFLVASGKTNAEIGELLHISGRTVEYHIGNILSKCGLRSRVEIATQIAAGRPLGAAG